MTYFRSGNEQHEDDDGGEEEDEGERESHGDLRCQMSGAQCSVQGVTDSCKHSTSHHSGAVTPADR